jgi:hypothetical protein
MKKITKILTQSLATGGIAAASAVGGVAIFNNYKHAPEKNSNFQRIDLTTFNNYVIKNTFSANPSVDTLKSSLAVIFNGGETSASIDPNEVIITVNNEDEPGVHSITVSPKSGSILYTPANNAKIYYNVFSAGDQQFIVTGNTNLQPGKSSTLTPVGLIDGSIT